MQPGKISVIFFFLVEQKNKTKLVLETIRKYSTAERQCFHLVLSARAVLTCTLYYSLEIDSLSHNYTYCSL